MSGSLLSLSRRLAAVLTILVILSVFPIATSCGKKTGVSASSVAVVVFSTGDFEIRRAGTDSWLSGSRGITVSEGDMVRTGQSSKLVLSFSGGQEIQVNSNTYLRITSLTGNAPGMDVSQGEVWLEESGSEKGLELDTPAAVATVEGTGLNLEVEPGGTSVLTVSTGKVAFSNEQGRVLVKESEQSTAVPGKAPTEPVVVELENINSWVLGHRFYVEMQIDPFYPDQESRSRAQEKAVMALQNDPGDSRARVDLGRALLDAGKRDEAKAEFAAALEDDPEHSSALSGLGKVELVSGRWERAEGYYEKACDSDPESFEAAYGLGQSLLGQGDEEEAKHWFEEAGKLDPRDASPLVALGFLKFIDEDLNGSIEEFKEATSVDPSLVRAYQALGISYSLRGDAERAEESLEKALELDPADYSSWNALGTLYMDQGKLEESMSCFKQLEGSDDNNLKSIGYQNLGMVQMAQGELSPAALSFNRSLELKGDNAAVLENLGWVFLLSDKPREAVSAFSRAVELEPDNWLAYEELAHAYWMMADMENARASAQRAVELNPNDWFSHLVLGLTLLAGGDAAGSLEELRLARELAPEKNLSAAEHFFLGYSYELEGNLQAALDEYGKAAKASPLDGSYHSSIASVLVALGREEEARGEYRKALELNPVDVLAMTSLAVLYHQEGNLEEALAELDKAVTVSPDDPFARWFLAEYLIEAGNPQAALHHVEHALAIPGTDPDVIVSLLITKGRVLDALGDLQSAVASYRDALSIDETLVEAWFQLAAVLEKTGDVGGAVDAYRKVIDLSGDEAGWAEYRKNAEEKLEQFEGN